MRIVSSKPGRGWDLSWNYTQPGGTRYTHYYVVNLSTLEPGMDEYAAVGEPRAASADIPVHRVDVESMLGL